MVKILAFTGKTKRKQGVLQKTDILVSKNVWRRIRLILNIQSEPHLLTYISERVTYVYKLTSNYT